MKNKQRLQAMTLAMLGAAAMFGRTGIVVPEACRPDPYPTGRGSNRRQRVGRGSRKQKRK